jgi:hypothetical protein
MLCVPPLNFIKHLPCCVVRAPDTNSNPTTGCRTVGACPSSPPRNSPKNSSRARPSLSKAALTKPKSPSAKPSPSTTRYLHAPISGNTTISHINPNSQNICMILISHTHASISGNFTISRINPNSQNICMILIWASFAGSPGLTGQD